jgi:hypothetical protein
MGYVDKELNTLSNSSRGLGKTIWFDASYDPGNFRVVGAFAPGFRELQDGRVELRGRLEKGTTNAQGVFTPVPLQNGDVIMQVPYSCSPPSNAAIRSSVTALAPCTITNNHLGVYRIDIEREPAWDERPVVNADGVQVLDADGVPQTEVFSMVNIVARVPENAPITGWVGFDGVVYDPHLYLDALAPVPYGQQPLIKDNSHVIRQTRRGVEWFRPGIDYRNA